MKKREILGYVQTCCTKEFGFSPLASRIHLLEASGEISDVRYVMFSVYNENGVWIDYQIHDGVVSVYQRRKR